MKTEEIRWNSDLKKEFGLPRILGQIIGRMIKVNGDTQWPYHTKPLTVIQSSNFLKRK